MKRFIRTTFPIIILVLICAKSYAQHPSGNEENIVNAHDDSMIKVVDKMLMEYLKEHELHKDNKDSAWILNYNTDTINKVVWDSRSKSKEGKTITLIDSITHNSYVLDTSHTVITAYSESNNTIWVVNPRKDYPISYYRHKNPKVTYFRIFELSTDWKKNYIPGTMDEMGNRVISIRYSNSQSGMLDLKTGNFVWLGQD